MKVSIELNDKTADYLQKIATITENNNLTKQIADFKLNEEIAIKENELKELKKIKLESK